MVSKILTVFIKLKLGKGDTRHRKLVPLSHYFLDESHWVPGEGVTGHHVPENVEDREGKGEAGHLNHRPLLL
jgi:hypothetical protein